MEQAPPSSVHRAGSASWLDEAVLLYGARKSGTTLLQALMDGGREMLVFPNELKLKFYSRKSWVDSHHMVADYLRHNTNALMNAFRAEGEPEVPWKATVPIEAAREPLTNVDATRVRAGTLSPDELDAVLDVPAYVDRLAAAAEREFSSLRELILYDVAALHDALRQPPDRLRMWAAKEAGGNDPVGLIGFFKALFPSAKVIVILRDPYFVVRSILMDRARRKIRMSARDVVRQVVEAFALTQGFDQVAGSRAVHFVPYERLVGGHLEEEMRNVCAHLGLTYDAAFVETTTLGRRSVVRTASVQENRVFSSAAASWKSGLSTVQVSLIESAAAAYRVAMRLRQKRVIEYRELVDRLARRPGVV